MNRIQKGFTLIELMIVVAIIGILAAIALPAYQDYTVRAKVSEAIIAGSSAKTTMSEAFQTDSTTGLISAATAWNAKTPAEVASKYVKDIEITVGSPYTIEVSIEAGAGSKNGIPTDQDNKKIWFSPNVQNAIPTDASTGAIDWACGSESAATATARGLGNVKFDIGTGLKAKYAPSECR